VKQEELDKYRQTEIEKENNTKALMLNKAFTYMRAVESSNLRQMGYDEETRELFIQFSDNSIYVYFNVIPVVYQKLVNAESLGKEFASLVKKVCPYKRLK
jgi:hypothetical protein